MDEKIVLTVSSNPLVRTSRDTTRIMLDVIIALIPALCVAVYMFGVNVIVLLCISVVSCVFFEWGYRKLMKKDKAIGDLSACVTGVLLVCVLPPSAPWWMPVIGAFFAIIIVKQIYGGIGKNFLNPALAARAFLFSYPVIMTTWAVPSVLRGAVDATTMATPLSYLYAGEAMPAYFSLKAMFIGTIPGCVGEISAAALLLGGAYLLIRKVITWQIPVSYIASVAVITLLCGREGYGNVDWMLYNLLSGGLMIGAIFMATDYSTSPVSKKGQIIYGIGCGALTVLIRYFGSYPEGVSYAILIMNICAWLIDQLTRSRRFGVTREDEKAARAAQKLEKKKAKEAAV